MRDRHSTNSTPIGRTQSGFYTPFPRDTPKQMTGFRRGVVLATYTQTTEDLADEDKPSQNAREVAVYCDVLTYGGREHKKFGYIPRCMVMQPMGAMHGGTVWKPRAATQDYANTNLEFPISDPQDIDGDHVLIATLDDDAARAIIVGAVPHPQLDTGNDNEDLGHRTRLKEEDGDPRLFKHRGSWVLVDDSGNITVDTTRAHDGVYDSSGNEQPKDDNSHGNVTFRVNSNTTTTIEGVDTDGANPTYSITIKDGEFDLRLSDGESLKITGKDGDVLAKVGGGSNGVVLGPKLQQMWDALKVKMDIFDFHTHPSPVGPTGTPSAAVAMESYPTDATSTSLQVPDEP